MKISLPLLLLLSIGISSCTYTEPSYYNYDSKYKPVLMERAVLENSIKLLEPQNHGQYGKIYRYDSLLFINEKFEGVHIYDNSDPSFPVNLGFISIPGNIDIAIKDGRIYADNAVDLVVMRYDGRDLQVLDRNKEVFPELKVPDGGYVPELSDRPENTVIIKWEEK